MSLYPLSRPCPKCGAEPGKLCSNIPAQPCDERWGNLVTQIDTDKLRALHEAANSKTMHPEDVASARFQLGNFVKGPNFPAILAMAEDNRRLREAGSNLAFASGALNIATDSLDHLTAKRENVLDALQAWERALAAPGDGG